MAITPNSSTRGSPNTPVTAEDLERHRQELGLVGRIFGDRIHAPIYVAASIVLISMVGMICIAFVPHSTQVQDADLLKILSGLVVSSLTFLGGYMSGRNK